MNLGALGVHTITTLGWSVLSFTLGYLVGRRERAKRGPG